MAAKAYRLGKVDLARRLLGRLDDEPRQIAEIVGLVAAVHGCRNPAGFLAGPPGDSSVHPGRLRFGHVRMVVGYEAGGYPAWMVFGGACLGAALYVRLERRLAQE